MIRRQWCIACIFLIIACIAAAAIPQAASRQSVTIDPFATLDFSAASFSSHRLSGSEVLEALDMFSAFSNGISALPGYHDPIPTRGSKGVALFRSASPAVTLVVVGTDKEIEGLGTGALVRSDGYVLTNWHVIAGHTAALIFLKPSSSAEVKDAQAFGARVVYQDQTSDLALLKLVRDNYATLPSISVADISSVQIAEDVHIIGHPHGELWSYSTGVISQIRDDYAWKYSDGSRHHARVLQMQTAINPGNSGGPVLDDSGSMIGLVAMSEEGQNLDYAIAADVIQRFLRQGYAMGTRGGSSSPELVVPKAFTAKGPGKKEVTKLVYADATVYWLSEPGTSDAELYVVDTKGDIIHAEKPNQSGGFSEWSGHMRTGNVLAKSEGKMPQIFMKP